MIDDEKSSDGRAISSARGQRLALTVGVNTSVKSLYRAPLKYAEDDAYEMARILASPASNFTLLKPALLGKEATTRDIKEAIIDLIKASTDEDFLCFYFSGHAQPMKVKGGRQDVFLVTNDFSESQVELDPSLHLSMSWLWEVLYQQTEVRRLLVILDCCYAGNMLTTGPDPYQIDLYNLFNNYFEGENPKQQENRSRFILTATGYDALAHERDGHGVMTGFLLKALRGEDMSAYDREGYLDVYALYTYLQNSIQEQQPNLSGEGRHRCLLAWYSPQSETFRKVARKVDRVLITEADFFDRLQEINVKPYKQPFDHTLCKGSSLADIKIEVITNFFQRERVKQQQDFSSGMTNQELLEQFGLIRESLLTYGTLLCFGKNPSRWVSGAFTRCILWKGNDRYEGFEEDQFFRGNLLEQFESAIDFLQRNLHLGRVIRTGGSIEQWEIPPIALREALANALIHREYSDQTNFVQVEIFNDRIEINSPGGLPAPLKIQQLGTSKQYPLRNPQIARIFYLYNYVEEAGSGILRIQRAMRDAGLPRPKFSVSDGRTFSLVLRRPRYVTSQQMTEALSSSIRRAVDSKQSYQLLSLLLTAMLLIMVSISNFPRFFSASPVSNPSSPIVIINAPDGEAIGISDGTFAFDTNRADGQLKILAASNLKQGNKVNAVSLFTQAVVKDTNDAEALIYLENMQVLASRRPYITFVVGTMLSGSASNVITGRDDLQGAYVAQKEYNDSNPGVLVRLWIANSGGQADYATTVAQQIVQAAKQDHTIIGVMGWPFSANALNAVNILSQAHIPIVSQTASSDELTGISPYFFRVAPPNKAQAIAGAKYAEQQLHVSRAALFFDPANAYSQSLANDFRQQFTSDGNKIVATEKYTVGQTVALPELLHDALNVDPQMIYFSGYSDDMAVLLTDLPADRPDLQVMGGDGLYELHGYPSSVRAEFSRLHFTAFAYPDEWSLEEPDQPPFFKSYAQDFAGNDDHTANPYGYTRPDNDVILSYDAMQALLQGCENALTGSGTPLTPEALRQGLIKITPSQPIQGISGQIAFGPKGDPVNKAIVVLYVDSQGFIKLALNGIQNCYLAGHC